MSVKEPLLSVVMSVYNSEDYLSEAIESILGQTYKNFEFIIIDDGSTDKSLKIIKNYQKQDSRIVIISRENKGLPYSLNEGIRKAKGKYIVRMDADDMSLPTRFEKQVKFMEDNPDIGISGSDIVEFGENLKTSVRKVLKNNEGIKCELLFSSTFAHPSVIINKNMIFKYNLFYNNHFPHVQDFELWTRMAKVTKMANISEPLLKYRIVENSITGEANKNPEERYLTHKKIFNAHLSELGIQNSDEESRLHFNVSLYRRLKEHKVCFTQLDDYFNKLIISNDKKNIFDRYELKKVLGKRWLVNVYYRKDIRRFFSRYTLYGILGLINRRIV